MYTIISTKNYENTVQPPSVSPNVHLRRLYILSVTCFVTGKWAHVTGALCQQQFHPSLQALTTALPYKDGTFPEKATVQLAFRNRTWHTEQSCHCSTLINN